MTLRACALVAALLLFCQLMGEATDPMVPGGIAEKLASPCGGEKIQWVESKEDPAKAEVLPGGIAEEFIDPYKKSEPALTEPSVAEKEEPSPASDAVAAQAPMEKSAQEDETPMVEPVKPAAAESENRWYVALKPGYYLFSDKDMRQFYDDGGFTCRFEAGCKVWKSLIVWFDGSYFQKDGKAIGGHEKLELKLATITLGLKGIYNFNSYASVYAGAGPRIFMLMMHNDSPFVRGDDNAIGIGGGFDGGLWLFPVQKYKNFFFDLFADYSWKKMKIEPDEISSTDSDVDVSGLTVGLGIGIKF